MFISRFICLSGFLLLFVIVASAQTTDLKQIVIEQQAHPAIRYAAEIIAKKPEISAPIKIFSRDETAQI